MLKCSSRCKKILSSTSSYCLQWHTVSLSVSSLRLFWNENNRVNFVPDQHQTQKWHFLCVATNTNGNLKRLWILAKRSNKKTISIRSNVVFPEILSWWNWWWNQIVKFMYICNINNWTIFHLPNPSTTSRMWHKVSFYVEYCRIGFRLIHWFCFNGMSHRLGCYEVRETYSLYVYIYTFE